MSTNNSSNLSLWLPGGHKPRAISLTRVSDNPKLESTSHGTQHAANLRCIEDLGAVLYRHYEENVSGALYNARAETQLALDDLEADRADYLILYDMTRYGRSVRWQQEILARIERAQKRVQFATFRLEYDPYTNRMTAYARFAFNNFGNMSEMERHSIKERMLRGKRAALEKNIAPGVGLAPFGWQITTKADVIRGESALHGQYEQIPEQAQVVKELYQKADAGAGVREMARYLASRGLKTARGGIWSPATVRSILMNPAHKGMPAYGKSSYVSDDGQTDGTIKITATPRDRSQWSYLKCEPIVDAALWERVNQKIRDRSIRSGPRQKRYLLSGLLFCPLCGSRMTGSNTNTGYKNKSGQTNRYYVRRYRCTTPSRFTETGEKQRCSMKPLRCNKYEPLVIEAIQHVLQNPQLLQAAYDDYKERAREASKPQKAVGEKQIKAWGKALDDVNRREEATARAKIEAMLKDSSVAVYDKLLDELSQQRTHLLTQINQANQEKVVALPPVDSPALQFHDFVSGLGAQLTAIFANESVLDNEAKNALLRQVIERITVPGVAPDDNAPGGLIIHFVPLTDGLRFSVHNTFGVLRIQLEDVASNTTLKIAPEQS